MADNLNNVFQSVEMIMDEKINRESKKRHINTMKKDVKMLTEVLDIISKKRKQINFDSNAARHQMAIEVVHELRKRRCQINKIEL